MTNIAAAYFDALATGDFASVPWSGDAVLYTPLLPEPLRGREAIESFFRPHAGTFGEIRLLDVYSGGNPETMVAEAEVGPLRVMDKFVLRGGWIVEQRNVFDPRPLLEAVPPGGLTKHERQWLVESLESGRELVREVTASVRDEDWTRAPAAGGWTPAQCLEHLVLTEQALLALVRDQMLAGTPDPALAQQLTGREVLVVNAMRDRAQKSTTFAFLEPQGSWPGKNYLLDAFLARRAATLDLVRATAAPVHYHGQPLGAFGMLDAFQWLVLIAEHTNRHAGQMQTSPA